MLAVNKKKRLFYALIALFIIIKTALAVQPHPVIWDEAVYSGMGKFLYSNGEAGLWEQIRPVGLPIILGAMWKAGMPSAAYETAMALFGAGMLAVTYLAGRKLFNPATGLLAALLVAGTGLFFRQSSLFLTEIPSTFFAMLSIYLVMEKKHYLGGAAAAMAAMLKFPHFLLLLPIAAIPLLEFAKTKNYGKLAKDSAKIVMPYVAITGTFLLGNYIAYGESASDIGTAIKPLILAASHQANPAEAVSGAFNNALFYFAALLKQNVFYAFLPAGLILMLRELRASGSAQSIIAYLAAYAAYFTIIANKQERFALLLMPAAAIITAYGFYRFMLTGKGSTKTGIAITTIVIAAAVFASANVVSEDAAYVKERINADLPDYSSYEGKFVLASEPLAAHYTDSKIVPYYFSTADGKEGIRKAVERFEANKESSEAIFNRDNFYCEEKDAYCQEQLQKVTP